MEVAALENSAGDVRIVVGPGAQPLQGSLLVAEGRKKDIGELGRIERGSGQGRYSFLDLYSVHAFILGQIFAVNPSRSMRGFEAAECRRQLPCPAAARLLRRVSRHFGHDAGRASLQCGP
jgi:hypothetical protein